MYKIVLFVSLLSLFSCKSPKDTTLKDEAKSATVTDLPKRDFLIMQSDTGNIKINERFNVECVNGVVNLSAFMENGYLVQITGIPRTSLSADTEVDGNLVQFVITRPPLKPCLSVDKSQNKISFKTNEKRSALLINGQVVCDGMLFSLVGAYTGEIPACSTIELD